jgi:hypothetical protein
LITAGALVLVLAAALGPAAIMSDKPKTGDERRRARVPISWA